MISLLPIKEKRRLTRTYIVRLGSLVCLMMGLLVLVGAFLELPSYIYFTHRLSGVVAPDVVQEGGVQLVTSDQERRVDEIATLIAREEEDFVSQIESLRAIIGGDVRLDSLTLEEGVWKVVGWAPTRSSLLALTESLEAEDWIREVELPVDALARSSDIAFTLTVTPQ